MRDSLKGRLIKILFIFVAYFVCFFVISSGYLLANNGPLEVWVSRAYNESTPGWSVTHFAAIQQGEHVFVYTDAEYATIRNIPGKPGC